jgi:hypothetical protein
MLCVIEPLTVLSAISFVFFSVYGLALGVYGFVRRGSIAFVFMIVSSAIGLFVSIANVALVCDSYIGMRLLGHTGWKIFYYAFVCVQPIASLLTAIAMTLLTLSAIRKDEPFRFE